MNFPLVLLCPPQKLWYNKFAMKRTLLIGYLLLILTGTSTAEQIGIVTGDRVRVRTKPTTVKSKTIGYANAGDKVVILDKSIKKAKIGTMENHWYRIKYNDVKDEWSNNIIEGWIFGYYVRTYEIKKTTQSNYSTTTKIPKGITVAQEFERYGWRYARKGLGEYLRHIDSKIIEELFRESILTPSYYDKENKKSKNVTINTFQEVLQRGLKGEIKIDGYLSGMGHGATIVGLRYLDYQIIGYGIPIAETPTRGGIYIYNTKSKEIVKHMRFNERINTLIYFQESIWIGSNKGVYRLSNNFQKLIFYGKDKGLIEGNILGAFAIYNGTLWCSIDEQENWDMYTKTTGGIGKYVLSSDSWVFYDYTKGVPGKWVYEINIEDDLITIRTENGWAKFMPN